MRGLCGPALLPARLRALPPPVVQIIGLLIAANVLVWTASGVVLHYFPSMITPAVLSYTLGLRHALDADHISAIDLMTRRLIAAGQRPVTVGTFFSLGHSTIVVATCVVVAATSGALRDRFDNFAYVGGIVGTSVSAAFLVLLCLGNGWVLYRLVGRLRCVLREQQPGDSSRRENQDGGRDGDDEDAADEDQAANNLQLEGAGFLASVFRGLFRVVDRPWKMYPLGVLFGLGFDTSSEIAILGIASVQGAQGTSLWVILIFPLLFTGKFSSAIPFFCCQCPLVDETIPISWHVLAGYHRRSFNDEPLHIKGLRARHCCNPVLLDRVDGHHRRCRRLHRHHPDTLASAKRSRARRQVLGWVECYIGPFRDHRRQHLRPLPSCRCRVYSRLQTLEASDGKAEGRAGAGDG